ncbi:MAG: hypothetical protein WBZ37_26460 [Mycobacterium sp.]
MIDLPRRIGVFGSAPVDRPVGVMQCGGTVVGEGEHRRIQGGDDPRTVL